MQETAFAIFNYKARCDQELTLKYEKTAQKYEQVFFSDSTYFIMNQWDSVACVISQCRVLSGSIPSSVKFFSLLDAWINPTISIRVGRCSRSRQREANNRRAMTSLAYFGVPDIRLVEGIAVWCYHDDAETNRKRRYQVVRVTLLLLRNCDFQTSSGCH
ncbi:uncharacterized protein [Oscarella lobularis]|uniref:uncharacterized protein n=1 Tax=Oscarella lobularis TaxID=121494 RepID=UPI003313FEAB